MQQANASQELVAGSGDPDYESNARPSKEVVLFVAQVLVLLPITLGAIVGLFGAGYGLLFKESFSTRPALYVLFCTIYFGVVVGAVSLWGTVCATDSYLKTRGRLLLKFLFGGIVFALIGCAYLIVMVVLTTKFTMSLLTDGSLWSLYLLLPTISGFIQLSRVREVLKQY
ncbi:MAG: hypothetical protein CFE43_05205 [Burkholderiales bacterium PBB3]|nr:MAG: hypothetical protein CFE43_05205 [Burkholderiales bacterium PBB3]